MHNGNGVRDGTLLHATKVSVEQTDLDSIRRTFPMLLFEENYV